MYWIHSCSHFFSVIYLVLLKANVFFKCPASQSGIEIVVRGFMRGIVCLCNWNSGENKQINTEINYFPLPAVTSWNLLYQPRSGIYARTRGHLNIYHIQPHWANELKTFIVDTFGMYKIPLLCAHPNRRKWCTVQWERTDVRKGAWALWVTFSSWHTNSWVPLLSPLSQTMKQVNKDNHHNKAKK